MNRNISHRRGFSLIELLAVITLLGIIAVIVIPRLSWTSLTSKQAACFENKATINKAIEQYWWDNNAWPADTSVLAGVFSFPDGVPVCPVSGAAYAFDATTHRVLGHSGSSH